MENLSNERASLIRELQDAILKLHGCTPTHVRTARVREMFKGKIVWNGEVEVFEVKGHPTAKECYAWKYLDDNGDAHYTAVLGIPPVTSPETAVRAAIVAQVKNEDKET